MGLVKIDTKNDAQALALKKENQKNKAVSAAALRGDSTASSVYSMGFVFNNEGLDFSTLAQSFVQQKKNISQGKTNDIEAMLLGQAQVLQGLFYRHVEQAAAAQIPIKQQMHTEIVLKANNACRKTLLALQQIRHPNSATFIKHQNNAVNQQINYSDPRGGEKEKNFKKNCTNELLSEVTDESMDRGTEKTSSSINTPVEALVKGGGEN